MTHLSEDVVPDLSVEVHHCMRCDSLAAHSQLVRALLKTLPRCVCDQPGSNPFSCEHLGGAFVAALQLCGPFSDPVS